MVSMGRSALRVLIVDDHEVVRRGLVSLLMTQPGCVICGEATQGKEAIEKAIDLTPDVIVMDVSMPTLNGLDATRTIRTLLPSCEILVLSQHDSPEMVRQAFRSGARGYVLKSSVGKNLKEALQRVSRHETFIDPDISEVSPSLDAQEQEDVREIVRRSTALEQALLDSEALYRSTFELAAVGVAHLSPEGRWLRVNKKLCDILGYSETELLQLTLQAITHPDDVQTTADQISQLLNGEVTTLSTEQRCIRKDRSVVWINLTVSGLRDREGQLKHFICVLEDISERRRADEAQGRLAAIVASSDDGIISKDLNGIITSWNAGATRIFGYTPEETIGRHITLLIPPELHQEENKILARLRRGERIEHFETVRVAKSGRVLDVSLTISPVRDSKGQVIGASKIARDISDRKRIEDALRESQAQLTLALESSRTAIFDWDIVDKRGKWNDQLAGIYDFNPGRDYVTPEDWRQLFHPQDMERLAQEYERACKDQEKFQFEFRTVRPDGEIRWIFSHGRMVRDAHGNAIRMIGTHTDITDRKQVEEMAKVRELSGKLLHAQDAERRRIARELHDSAGQIVAALQMQLIPMESDAEKSNPEIAKGIQQSLDLIQQLSQELRTVSYLLHPPLLDELGLPSALRWYVEGFSERSKIDVQLELVPDLGRLPADMETTLFRIVQESLTNIHRHSGSKRAQIQIRRSADEISVEVRDYGKGMLAAKSNGSSPPLRSGVGIQGMQERVRQLNGRFGIQSRPDGTTVTARLPMAAAPVALA
jgi:PAS domain S-box-containing protein